MSKTNPNFRWSVIKDNFLSPEECDSIIKRIDDSSINTREEGNEVYEWFGKSYDSKKCIIDDTELKKKTWIATSLANTLHWKFNLDGIRYLGGMYYSKDNFKAGKMYHSDFDTIDTTHKVSGIVFLNDEYDGGGLKILNDVVESKQGRLVLFPAFAAHRVEQMYNHDRYTILVVVEGDSFV